MRGRRFVDRALVAVAAVALLGCVGSAGQGARSPWRAGDAHFEGGRDLEAARAYERALVRHPDAANRAETTIRLALVYLAQPETQHRARELLDDLVRRHRHTVIGREAQILLSHIDDRRRAETNLRAERERLAVLDAALHQLQKEKTELVSQLRTREDELLAIEEERQLLLREVEQRKLTGAMQAAQIEKMSAMIEALGEQLDALKDIDLGRRQ